MEIGSGHGSGKRCEIYVLEAGPNADAGREGGRVGTREEGREGGRGAETGKEKMYIVLGLGFYFVCFLFVCLGVSFLF